MKKRRAQKKKMVTAFYDRSTYEEKTRKCTHHANCLHEID